MKRLLAQIGITYFSVLAAAFYLPSDAILIIGIIALILAAVLFLRRNMRKKIFPPLMALAAVIACCVNLGYTTLHVQPLVDKYAGEEHAVVAVLKDEQYKAYSKFYNRLETISIDGEAVHTKFLLKTPHSIDADPDDEIRFTSELDSVENNYYRSKGYYLVADDYDIECEVTAAESHSLYYHAIQLRQKLRSALDRLLPDDCAALCKAVFIGDKYALDLDVRESFRYAGASYFIVVSGMHFAVLTMMVFGLLKLLRKRWITLGITLLFILLYMAVTGFQPSVMRSGLMMTLAIIGFTIRRQAFPLNHLGFAGLVLPIIFTPYGAGDIGLILSFYATLSILLWATPIAKKLCFTSPYGHIYQFKFNSLVTEFSRSDRKVDETNVSHLRLKKLYNAIAGVLSVSLAANILVIPISFFVFGAFSLVTLLSALLLYIPIYLILLLSLIVCILYWIPILKYLAIALSYPLICLCRFVLWIVEALGSLPFAYVKITSVVYYIWLIVTILLVIWVLYPRNGCKRLPIAALCSALLLIIMMLGHTFLNWNTLRLEVCDCGDGICTGVDSGGKLYLLSTDAKSRELYQALGDLSSRYRGAEAVICKNARQAEKLINYSSGKFAISDYLLYDKDGNENPGTICVENGGTYILDDSLIIRTVISKDHVIVYADAGEKTILIIPNGAKAEDIPEEWHTPDIMILSKNYNAAENISCTDLIICNTDKESTKITDKLRDHYENVYYTYQGEIRRDLR